MTWFTTSRRQMWLTGGGLCLAVAATLAGLLLPRSSGSGAAPPSLTTTKAAPPRILPLVRPIFDYASPEGQLVRSLLASPPSVRLSSRTLAHILRLCPVEAALRPHWDPGTSAMRIVTDDAACAKSLGLPLLEQTRYGARYQSLSHDPAAAVGENHRDYFLATFAELGLPTSTVLHIGQRAFTIADLLHDSEANYYADQAEIPWTAVAYRIYLAKGGRWQNRDGQQFTLDDLANSLLAEPRGAGSCGGTHVLYALILMDRDSPDHPPISPAVRSKLDRRVRQDIAAVIAAQSPEGYWWLDWGSGKPPHPGLLNTDFWRLLVTGHLVEFMGYLPTDLQPPSRVYRAAARWLYIQLVKKQKISAYAFCPWTHATIGLAHLTEYYKADTPTLASMPPASRGPGVGWGVGVANEGAAK